MVQHVVGASCIDMHPARKPPPVMALTVSKTRISLALQRARKSAFAWRVRCVSCVRTKLHMSGYLFVHTCMHVTCSNKILGNEPVTTSPMNARACCIGTSKKQDIKTLQPGHASAGNMRMSVKKDILLRASTRNAAKSPDKGLVVGEHARPAGLRL